MGKEFHWRTEGRNSAVSRRKKYKSNTNQNVCSRLPSRCQSRLEDLSFPSKEGENHALTVVFLFTAFNWVLFILFFPTGRDEGGRKVVRISLSLNPSSRQKKERKKSLWSSVTERINYKSWAFSHCQHSCSLTHCNATEDRCLFPCSMPSSVKQAFSRRHWSSRTGAIYRGKKHLRQLENEFFSILKTLKGLGLGWWLNQFHQGCSEYV